jgi:beta-propeller repeat-containing protein
MTRLCFRTGIALTALLAAAPARAAARPIQAAPFFEPNAGQAGADARFLLRTGTGTFFFTGAEVVMASSTASPLRVRFLDADPAAALAGAEPQPGTVNYFVGSDPERWQAGLPTYAELRYTSLYPGVVLAYRANGRPLKGTYTVAPGADPGRIRWRYEGGGARVDEAGRLQVTTGNGDATVTEEPPLAWQDIEGGRVPVPARYAIGPDGGVGFTIGAYDRRRPLTIDPVIVYSTYLGGSMFDIAWSVAADAAGNAYIAGDAESMDFPTVSPFQPSPGGQGDAFVAKFAPDGTPVYCTYLGGNNFDYATDIAVDLQGNAYVTGKTGSVNFPTKNAFQPSYAGSWDAFVTKLNPTGSALVYSTYLGGSGEENYINAGVSGAIAVDPRGAAYVTGSTQSANFPTKQPFQPTLKGSVDAFVTKIGPAGNALVYSTFLGGTGGETGWAIAVDRGQAVVTGDTTSDTTFPTQNAFQPVCAPGAGGCWDAFVTRLSPDGQLLVFSTYLGGNDVEWIDRGMGVAVDRFGTAYVTGMTGSSNFPRLKAYQFVYGGQIDAFVTRFNRNGLLLSSTYLGGNNSDVGYAIAVDRATTPSPGAHVSGLTLSPNFPVVEPLQASLGAFEDAFVAKFDLSAGDLLFSTYLGGTTGREEYGATGIAVDGQGNAYVTGGTEATDFPIQSAYQPGVHGSYDAFLTRIDH